MNVLLTRILELLYPPRCIFCDEVMIYNGPRWVCERCYKTIRFVPNQNGDGKFDGDLSESFSLLFYEDDVREAILRYKYDDMRDYSIGFAILTKQNLAGFEAERAIDESDCFVPVPLHKSKLKKRGFNQAERYAAELSKLYNKPTVPENLIRLRDTQRQSELDAKRRAENISGAFSVQSPNAFKSKNIMLIDDIITTGATLNECARVLRESGCGKIFSLTIATTEKG